ncbi:hypothetical protein [Flagellimonas allohymeniacidonis]|uniref:Prenyltransferase n=1 Tax=Flagellimonas allohymeniacidonis TaxID=2517819 RepID=A0A4Q8QGN6_9FLAO|nr:hypothetical protein [Allomuricauda hymeniacidonis]TAI49715.1 hypothetical protein EW142_07940 [Allomuricauda hymeniacidonis]
MRLLRAIFNFYLDASVHVAFAVVSLFIITTQMLNISLNFSLVGFIFFATIVCYNFVKYGVEAEKYLIVANAYHKNIQIFSFLSFGLALLFGAQLSKELWLAILLLGMLSALYAIPLLPSLKNLRNLGGLKVYVVAAVWSGFTVLLPILEAKLSFSWDLGVLLVQRFILVLILILPFEIRDLKWDDPKLRTIPQVIGVQQTRILGVVLTGIFFLMTFLKDDVTQQEIIARLFLTSLLMLFFRSGSRFHKDYFVSLWVEAIPIFWLCFYWALESFL